MDELHQALRSALAVATRLPCGCLDTADRVMVPVRVAYALRRRMQDVEHQMHHIEPPCTHTP